MRTRTEKMSESFEVLRGTADVEPEDTKYILNTEDKFKNIFEKFNEKLDDFISKSEINYNKFYK